MKYQTDKRNEGEGEEEEGREEKEKEKEVKVTECRITKNYSHTDKQHICTYAYYSAVLIQFT